MFAAAAAALSGWLILIVVLPVLAIGLPYLLILPKPRDVELLEYMELLAVFESSSRRLLPAKYATLTPEELDTRLRLLRTIVGTRR